VPAAFVLIAMHPGIALATDASPAVSIDVDPCGALDRDEVSRILAVELEHPLAARGTPGSVHVSVRCPDDPDALRIEYAGSSQPVTRVIDLRHTDESGRARLVAVAIEEFIAGTNEANAVTQGEQSSPAPEVSMAPTPTTQTMRFRFDVAIGGAFVATNTVTTFVNTCRPAPGLYCQDWAGGAVPAEGHGGGLALTARIGVQLSDTLAIVDQATGILGAWAPQPSSTNAPSTGLYGVLQNAVLFEYARADRLHVGVGPSVAIPFYSGVPFAGGVVRAALTFGGRGREAGRRGLQISFDVNPTFNATGWLLTATAGVGWSWF
jgi:hypothetical protein